MWLSCVWLERRESDKEQNKAFKFLKLFISKETKLFKKEKKQRNRIELTQEDEAKKKKKKRKGVKAGEEEDEEAKKKKTKNSELRTDTARRSL